MTVDGGEQFDVQRTQRNDEEKRKEEVPASRRKCEQRKILYNRYVSTVVLVGRQCRTRCENATKARGAMDDAKS